MDQHTIKHKWQAKWEENKTYCANLDLDKPKYYVLDMFPYPSGNGLHVGHAVGYIGSDIIARQKRMSGFNVLHPMGWDAFGLPAEQYAIKTGISPDSSTTVNCENFRQQLKNMGLSYDWEREISTCAPEFFKWTQYLFLKLYEKGLVYESEQYVWWCDDLKTVLANEEVINGRSERGDYPCIRKPLKQWMIKITEYAERLLDDLDELEWPDSVKRMQREWIGRSEGADIRFAISENKASFIEVFSTRPETIYGVNAIVVSTEHPILAMITDEKIKSSLTELLNKLNALGEDEVDGFDTGIKAIHPFTKNEVPIFVSNYVLSSYGHGAVMSVPAHDERDQKFSEQMSLEYFPVFEKTEDGTQLKNSDIINGLSEAQARDRIIQHIEDLNLGKRIVRYKLHDWMFSRQRYWGEPFPLYRKKGQEKENEQDSIVPAKYDELPITLPTVEDYTPTEDGQSPLQRETEWINQEDENGNPLYRVTDTMPGWAGSCWYYLRFMDPTNDSEPFSKEAMNYWNQVDLYIGGAAHATMHLLYARFWHKVLYDLDIVSYKEPFKQLFNQGLITADAFRDETGRIVPVDEAETDPSDTDAFISKKNGQKLERFNTKMSKSLLNVVTPETVIDEYGVDSFRMYMMFLGPLDKGKKWQYDSISGCSKIIKRIWNLYIDDSGSINAFMKQTEQADGNELNKAWSNAFYRIDSSFSKFNFNTAVAAFMEFMNNAEKLKEQFSLDISKQLILALAPFAPHIASELWERMEFEGEVHYQPWPKVEVKNEQQIKLMINSKFIAFAEWYSGNQSDDEEAALKQLQHRISKDEIKKVVYVPGRIINFLKK